MKFVIASNNKGKIAEIRAILQDMGLDAWTQTEAGVDVDVDETGVTFAENALLKARAVCVTSGLPAIADDSGLMVDALGGEPGVYSKRYGGGLTDPELCERIVKNMEGKEPRDAQFVSSIACVFPNGDLITAEGICRGEILDEPRGAGGFGYDPVFLVHGTGKSMAELTLEEKNAVSHRGNALRNFADRLKTYLNSEQRWQND